MTINNVETRRGRNPIPMPHDEKEIPETRSSAIGEFSGVLFDMDGTLIDSTNAIVKFWER